MTDMTSETVLVRAPAKINLALSVGPAMSARSDHPGMHPICSWMATIDFCDELVLRRLEPGRLSRYAIGWHRDAPRRTDIDWPVTSDLAVRAHMALEKKARRPLPVQLKLDKRIPVESGLGGGSSDAAAMLRGLNELFSLRMPMRDLAEVAASLGSDVPFFLYGGHAIVSGLGERIEPAFGGHESAGVLHMVVVLPSDGCATADVYRKFDLLKAAQHALREDGVRALIGQPAGVLSDALFNDLEQAAEAVSSGLKTLRAQVAAVAERRAHITGSGSAMFVVCDDQGHASALAKQITQECDVAAAAARTGVGD